MWCDFWTCVTAQPRLVHDAILENASRPCLALSVAHFVVRPHGPVQPGPWHIFGSCVMARPMLVRDAFFGHV